MNISNNAIYDAVCKSMVVQQATADFCARINDLQAPATATSRNT